MNCIRKIAIGMMAFFMVGTSLLQGAINPMSERVILIIKQKPTTSGNSPRGVEDNPFYAELTEQGVFLAADSDWGEATVTLSSLEGDYYQTIFDMADGAILLPINGNNGDSYTITIVTPGDIVFEGEFYL